MSAIYFRPIPLYYEESMLKFRYLLEFPTESGIEFYYIHLKSKPSITLGTEKVNGSSYVAGKAKWNPIEITIIDSIGPGNCTEFLKWINFFEKKYYDNYAYACNFKKNITLSQTDPVGIVLERWTFTKCYLNNRENIISDLENLNLTINFDRAFFDDTLFS